MSAGYNNQKSYKTGNCTACEMRWNTAGTGSALMLVTQLYSTDMPRAQISDHQLSAMLNPI